MDRVPVFYTPLQVVNDDVGISPSARKPAAVVASWQTLGLPIQILKPTLATVADFERAHDPDHVRAVLTRRHPNGFGNRLESVAKSLPWTTGSLLTAARYVLAAPDRPVAVSPTSGFHHAGYDSCEGFCTFNGLMVTVLALQNERPGLRVGILDCDAHYGNGTVNIIERRNVGNVQHYTFGGEGVRRETSSRWIRRFPDVLQRFAGCDILLYQAGADPHVDDPLGGSLTTAQLLERDRVVFEGARALKIPIVWNLAGGYQQPLRKVLDLHDNTMRACVAAFVAGV